MKISKFVDSFIYLLFMAIISFCSWYFDLPILMISIYLLLTSLAIFSSKGKVFIGLFIMPMFAFKAKFDYASNNNMIMMFCYLFIFITLLLYTVLNRNKIRFNLVFISFIIILSCFFESLIYSYVIYGLYEQTALLYLLLLTFIAFYYLLLFSNLKIIDNLNYIYSIMVFVGLLISLEVFCSSNNADLFNQTVNLGWGQKEEVALIMLICFTFTFYLFSKNKLWIFGFLSFPMVLTILICNYKVALLVFGIDIILLMIFTFIKFNRKYQILIHSLAFISLIIFAIVCLLNEQFAGTQYIKKFFAYNWLDSDLFNTWGSLFNGLFYSGDPICPGLNETLAFGSSANCFVKINFLTNGNLNNLLLVKNTWLNVFVSGGIIGLILTACFYFIVYKRFGFSYKYKEVDNKIILIIFLITSDLYGIFSNSFLVPSYMVIYFSILAYFEKNFTKEEIATYETFNK